MAANRSRIVMNIRIDTRDIDERWANRIVSTLQSTTILHYMSNVDGLIECQLDTTSYDAFLEIMSMLKSWVDDYDVLVDAYTVGTNSFKFFK